MKKRNIVSILLTMLLCVLTLGFISCTSDKETIMTIEYGETFTIPFASNYEVRDSYGNIVDVVNGKVSATDINGYTITHKNGNRTVKVVDTTAPEIVLSYEYKNVAVNSDVSLPELSLYDNYYEQPIYVADLTKDGDNVLTYDNKFVAESEGIYEYTVTAKDKFDNESKKTAVIKVFASGDKRLTRIAAFSEEYGLNQVTQVIGADVSYNKSVKFGDEVGSTKLTVKKGYWEKQGFVMRNLLITDVSESYGIVFNVYNDSDGSNVLSINGVFNYPLNAKTWSQIYIPSSDYFMFSQAKNTVLATRVSEKDINGLSLVFGNWEYKGVATSASFYISDMYVVPKLKISEFNARAEKITNIDTQVFEYNMLNLVYDQYNDNQKSRATGYTRIFNLYRESILRLNLEDKDETIFYAEEGVLERQIQAYSAILSYSSTMSPPTEPATGSYKVKVGGMYEARLYLTHPVFGGNSFVETDQDGRQIYSYIELSVYAPKIYSGKLYCSYFSSAGETVEELKQGEWNNLRFKVADTIANSSIALYKGIDVRWDSPATDIEFYVSSIKGVRNITPDSLMNQIDLMLNQKITFMNNSEIAASKEIKDILDIYNAYTDSEKERVTTYRQLFELYYEKSMLAQGITPNTTKAFYLDSNFVEMHDSAVYGGIARYTEKFSYSGDEGKGSTEIFIGNNNWEYNFTLSSPYKRGNTWDFYRCFVYIHDAQGVEVGITTTLDYAHPTILREGEWRELIVPVNKDGSVEFAVFADQWRKRVPSGLTIYMSALNHYSFITDEMEQSNKVIFSDEEFGVRQVNALRGSVNYSNEYKYTGDTGTGSIKYNPVGGQWDGVIRFERPYKLKNEKSYRVYLYLADDGGYSIDYYVTDNWVGHLGLVKGQWVEVTLTAAQLENGLTFHVKDWTNELPQNVEIYISSVREVA